MICVSNNFNNLPADIQSQIFSFLDKSSEKNALIVCKEWNQRIKKHNLELGQKLEVFEVHKNVERILSIWYASMFFLAISNLIQISRDPTKTFSFSLNSDTSIIMLLVASHLCMHLNTLDILSRNEMAQIDQEYKKRWLSFRKT